MDNITSLSEVKPPIPWTLIDIVLGLIVWGLLLLGLGLLIHFLSLPIDSSAVIIVGEATLLIPVWYFTIHKYGVNWADLGFRAFNPSFVSMGCGLMILFFIFHLFYASLLAFFNLQTQPGLDKIFDDTTTPFLLFFGGAVVAPFVEETFFRGFVFVGLRDRWGWQWAVVASSTLFALAHVVPTSFIPIFFLGLIFALITQISGSIWPAVLIHTLNNSIALLLVYINTTNLLQ
ncbi:CPBP family intramembrane metalloprotease [Anaerolineales bacterium HSG25]|nr:CPBP family intramembrane metalloprotease [Anaerolineales bacterium HSG25]